MKKSYEKLLSDISNLRIIDAHEHLQPEKDRVSVEADVFTLFSHYTKCDLGSAGMSEEDKLKLHDRNISLEKRWQIFEPYWDKIRFTSYAKSALLTLQEIYGFSDFNADNYRQISEKIKQANKPGLYKKILSEKCNIETVLNQGFVASKDDPLFKTVYHFALNPLWEVQSLEDIEKTQSQLNLPLKTAEDISNSVRQRTKHLVEQCGVVGFKLPVSMCFEREGLVFSSCPSNDEINTVLRQIQNTGTVNNQQQDLLRSLVIHSIIPESAELNVPIAVHAGLAWDSWVNYHSLTPSNIVPWLRKYRDVKFDVYHVGIPWYDEVMILAKMYPNVWLNFCWCHIISQRLSVEMLSRLIDLIPTNKIIGFGGDYNNPVEKVFGHLTMARQNIAKVLSGCIESGQMTYDKALEIAHNWLYNNPKQLYNL